MLCRRIGSKWLNVLKTPECSWWHIAYNLRKIDGLKKIIKYQVFSRFKWFFQWMKVKKLFFWKKSNYNLLYLRISAWTKAAFVPADRYSCQSCAENLPFTQKWCHKAALGLLIILSKTAAFGIFGSICMQNAFFLNLHIHNSKRVRAVGVFFHEGTWWKCAFID